MVVTLSTIINAAVPDIQLYDRVVSNNLEQIYDNNKDAVTQNSKHVYGEHQQNH